MDTTYTIFEYAGKFGKDAMVIAKQKFRPSKPSAHKGLRSTSKGQRMPSQKTAWHWLPPQLDKCGRSLLEGTKYQIGKAYGYSERSLRHASRILKSDSRTSLVVGGLLVIGAAGMYVRQVRGRRVRRMRAQVMEASYVNAGPVGVDIDIEIGDDVKIGDEAETGHDVQIDDDIKIEENFEKCNGAETGGETGDEAENRNPVHPVDVQVLVQP
jgi:hypothetical protein